MIGEMPKGPAVFEDGEVRRPTPPQENAEAATSKP